MAPRFFVPGVLGAGDVVTFEGGDARKMLTVLRMKTGDELRVVDSAGRTFEARLVCESPAVRARLLAVLETPPPAPAHITVAQGIPKGQKMDFVVEKLTELGAAAIVPFECERSVVTGVGNAKIERWRRLAKTASQQCGRTGIARVDDPLTFAQLLEGFGSYDCVLFAWELAERVPLRQTLPALVSQRTGILVVVGPEGGFTHDEAAAARSAGAQPLWLGPRILRAETAGLVLLSVLQYLLDPA